MIGRKTIDHAIEKVFEQMKATARLTGSKKVYLSAEELVVLLKADAIPLEINKAQGPGSYAHTIHFRGLDGTHTSTTYLARLKPYEDPTRYKVR